VNNTQELSVIFAGAWTVAGGGGRTPGGGGSAGRRLY